MNEEVTTDKISSDSNEQFIISTIQTPKYIWEIEIVNRDFVLYTRFDRNWFHRLMTKICFGWKWKKL